MSTVSPFNLIPDETALQILSYLNACELVCCTTVCRRFNALVQDASLKDIWYLDALKRLSLYGRTLSSINVKMSPQPVKLALVNIQMGLWLITYDKPYALYFFNEAYSTLIEYLIKKQTFSIDITFGLIAAALALHPHNRAECKRLLETAEEQANGYDGDLFKPILLAQIAKVACFLGCFEWAKFSMQKARRSAHELNITDRTRHALYRELGFIFEEMHFSVVAAKLWKRAKSFNTNSRRETTLYIDSTEPYKSFCYTYFCDILSAPDKTFYSRNTPEAKVFAHQMEAVEGFKKGNISGAIKAQKLAHEALSKYKKQNS